MVQRMVRRAANSADAADAADATNSTNPGDATAVEPLITVQGAASYHHPGSILFTTVSLAGDVNAYALLHGWLTPTDEVVSRQEINMLISRCRRDLVQAGLAGARLLERAPGGGGTRLVLAPGGTVAFEE